MAALQSRGDSLACGGAGGDGYEDKITDLGVRFVPLPVNRRALNPFADLKLFWSLYRWYREERPDVVHHFTIKPVIYGSLAAYLARVPRIVNTVTGLGYVFTSETIGILRRLVEILYRVALASAHYTFFQNPDDRTLFVQRRLVDGDKAGLLPGSGVDTGHFAPQGDSASTSDDHAVFLMIARLLKDKGVYEFVEAARIVKAKYPECEFQLLGGRDDRNPSVISAEEIDSWQRAKTVVWLGEVTDVRSSIAGADVVVLPSFYREGTPRSLLEAASMGKPLIATDAVGCREAVDHDLTGLLIPVRDASALAAAMEKLVTSPEARSRMGAAGRNKMVTQFEEKQVIAKVLAHY